MFSFKSFCVCTLVLCSLGIAQAQENKTKISQSNVSIEKPKSAAVPVPWQENEIVAEGVKNISYKSYDLYRKFLGINEQGQYLVQEFYKETHQKHTDPYIMLSKSSVTNELDGSYFDLTFWGGSYFEQDRVIRSADQPDDGRYGSFTSYYPDGTKEIEGNFLQGKQDGQWQWWYPTGELLMKGHYQNSLREGAWELWHATNPYHSTLKHRLAQKGLYEHGRREGVWLSWHANGQQLLERHYHKGWSTGSWAVWDEYGKKYEEGVFQNAKGVVNRWNIYSKGQIKQERHFDGINKTRSWRMWFYTEQLQESGRFKFGKKAGVWHEWDMDGNLMHAQKFPASTAIPYLAKPQPAVDPDATLQEDQVRAYNSRFNKAPSYQFDEAKTAAFFLQSDSFKVGDITYIGGQTMDVACEDDTIDKDLKCFWYRKFLGITVDDNYLVQDFYIQGDTKKTDPFLLGSLNDVRGYHANYPSYIGTVTTWDTDGKKLSQSYYGSGETHIGWHKNRKKKYVLSTALAGLPVGYERQWDKKGKLVDEIFHSCMSVSAGIDTVIAPWRVGDVVYKTIEPTQWEQEGISADELLVPEENQAEPIYRVFKGLTNEGEFLVQDFYQKTKTPRTSVYQLLHLSSLCTPLGEGFLPPQEIYEVWYPNGQKKSERYYVGFHVEGNFTEWYPNEQKKHEGSFYKSQPSGTWRWWDLQGNLIDEKYFK